MNFLYMSQNYPRKTKINSKKQFQKMRVGDLLVFKRISDDVNERRIIIDFDDNLNPLVILNGLITPIESSNFVYFERRYK